MDRLSRFARRYGSALVLVVSSIALLGIDCGNKTCTYNGKTWNEGDTFPSTDGCNSCSCTANGVACTEKACALKWYRTCGDPVCMGHKVDPNVPACTTQKAGDGCTQQNERCDPVDQCNVRLICTNSDPTQQPGGCPISLARYKRDIRYLDKAERDRVRDELLRMPLAAWRYKAAGDGAPERLGFIIDDVGATHPAVSPGGQTVDLYGYTSMTVAALQAQAEQIAALQKEVAALRRELASRRPAPRR